MRLHVLKRLADERLYWITADGPPRREGDQVVQRIVFTEQPEDTAEAQRKVADDQ